MDDFDWYDPNRNDIDFRFLKDKYHYDYLDRDEMSEKLKRYIIKHKFDFCFKKWYNIIS